jgi:hypothetical protein
MAGLAAPVVNPYMLVIVARCLLCSRVTKTTIQLNQPLGALGEAQLLCDGCRKRTERKVKTYTPTKGGIVH